MMKNKPVKEANEMINLDYVCIDIGQKIINDTDKKKIKDTQNNIRKALGVLQEDGVYAMFLWFEDKDREKKIRENLTELLNKENIKKYLLNNSDKFPENFTEFCEKLKVIAQDIDKLLFMKKVLERTLTYALYHAKIGE